MKKLKVSTILCLIFCCLIGCRQNNTTSSQEEKKNDLLIANLNGKVKSVREKVYQAEKVGVFTIKDINETGVELKDELVNVEKGELLEKNNISTIYDENGKITSSNLHNTDETIRIKEKFKYDDNGYKTEQTAFYNFMQRIKIFILLSVRFFTCTIVWEMK